MMTSQAAMSRPIPQVLTTREIEDLTATFQHFDLDGDGKISASELASVLTNLGESITEEEATRMIRVADRDGDGCIDILEFLSLNADAVSLNGPSRRKELEAVFETFDKDKNGLISPGELHRVMESLGLDDVSEEDCCSMIKNVDIDGDGLVNFYEFERLMLSDSPHSHPPNGSVVY